VLSVAAGETVEITYEREFEDLALTDVIDMPGEWWDATVRQLAARVAPAYAKPADQGGADRALALALGASVSGESVYWASGN
jgi:hypothetical protein